jgi:hypothetical protein
VTIGLSGVLTIVSVVVGLRGDTVAQAVVLGIATTAVAAYAAAVHPRSIFLTFATVLGFAPYTHLPLTEIPLLLVLALGIWVAIMFLPGVDARLGWCEVWVGLLALTALLSMVATGVSVDSLVEYVAWVAATAVVIPLRLLPGDMLVSVIRTFAVAAAGAAAVAMLLLADVLDGHGRLLRFLGYVPERSVFLFQGSDSVANRLSGTLGHPNAAALILAAGLLFAVAYFRRSARVILVTIVGSGLLLTLSRAVFATVVVVGLVVMLRSPARRLSVAVVGLAVGLVALATPIVRTRLVESFGPSDVGTVARLDALRDFPGMLDGHWVWGLGWSRDEFRDASVAHVVNFAANVPLVTIYRGGLVVGTVVVIVAVLLVVRSWFAARQSFEAAVVCGGVIGYILVAAQLDYPIVLQPPSTVVFSFLVAVSLTFAADPPPSEPTRWGDA